MSMNVAANDLWSPMMVAVNEEAQSNEPGAFSLRHGAALRSDEGMRYWQVPGRRHHDSLTMQRLDCGRLDEDGYY